MTDRKKTRTEPERTPRSERDDSAAARQRARERAAEETLPRKAGATKRTS